MKVIVTGASGGIGGAVSEKFLKEGHEVTGIDRRGPVIRHENYTHIQGDVRDYAVLPDIPGAEILVNCAGTQNEADIDINLKSLIGITERYGVRPGIKAVLHIGSASGHTGAEFPEYCASKGGIISYTKNVALRIAEYGAVCNSLDPGGVSTELNNAVMNDPVLWTKIMDETPLKRWASKEEIAEWVYFLTAVNRFCTGQSIVVDGGESILRRFIWPGFQSGSGKSGTESGN